MVLFQPPDQLEKISLADIQAEHAVRLHAAAELGDIRKDLTVTEGTVVLPYDADGELRFDLLEILDGGTHINSRQMDSIPVENRRTLEWGARSPWLFRSLA